MAGLAELVKRASSWFGFGPFLAEDEDKAEVAEGQIVYSKNNVCVHPMNTASFDKSDEYHHPGYLNIKSHVSKKGTKTFVLSWIPNDILNRNPRALEETHCCCSTQSASMTGTPICARHLSNDTCANSSAGAGDVSMESASVDSRETSRLTDSTGQSGDGVKSTSMEAPVSVDSQKSQTDSGIVADAACDNCTYSAENKDTHAHTDGDSSAENVPETISKSGTGDITKQTADIKPQTAARFAEEVLGVLPELGKQQIEVLPGEAEEFCTNSNTITTEAPSKSIETPSKPCSPTKKPTTLHVTAFSPSMEEDHVENNDEPAGLAVHAKPSRFSSCSSATSGPDSTPPTPPSPCSVESPLDYCLDTPKTITGDPENRSMDSPESVQSQNSFEVFTDGRRISWTKRFGVFSVDLSQMRTLRLFYTDEAYTCGQLVIASRESQYKILHFHHGGLDKLAFLLERNDIFVEPEDQVADVSSTLSIMASWDSQARVMLGIFSPRLFSTARRLIEFHCQLFMLPRPDLDASFFGPTPAHWPGEVGFLGGAPVDPEEGTLRAVNEEIWRYLLLDNGHVEDDLQLRKAIYYSGLDPSLRQEVWPFLLHYYPFMSTREERERIRNDKYIEYQNLRRIRERKESENEEAWKSIRVTIEKDVVRTDRSLPFFKGENNPNIAKLESILLTFAAVYPHIGYNQGMSDLLAPVLSALQNESDSYWCFVGLMRRTIFVSSPTDGDMDRQLTYLRELLRLNDPLFYLHLLNVEDGMELLFCHRWILLCFKREFSENEALRIWEACWAHYQTDYFHLFVCLSIITTYSDVVLRQHMNNDEILLHFNNLGGNMDAQFILRKARGLLHKFRQMRTIPCTLSDLCYFCGSGMWDSRHAPKVKCTLKHEGDCPYLTPVHLRRNLHLAE